MNEMIVADGANQRKVLLDISDQSCLPFGFKHGDKVLTKAQEPATIQGVALSNENEPVLWYSLDRLNNRICYYGGEKNLKEAGFVLLD
jgi:hypothetical protein